MFHYLHVHMMSKRVNTIQPGSIRKTSPYDIVHGIIPDC